MAIAVLNRFPAVVLMDSTTVTLPDELANVWVGCGGREPGQSIGAQGDRSAIRTCVRAAWRPRRVADAPRRSSPLQTAPLPAGGLRDRRFGVWVWTCGARPLSRSLFLVAAASADAWCTRRTASGLIWSAGSVASTGGDSRSRSRSGWMRGSRRGCWRCGFRTGWRRRAGRPSGRCTARRPDAECCPQTRAGGVDAPRHPARHPRVKWDSTRRWSSPAPAGRSNSCSSAGNGGQLDEWRSADPQRILCEVYAKLTALIINTGSCSSAATALCRPESTKAAHLVRDYAVPLLLALSSDEGSAGVLTTIDRRLAAGVPSRPSPAQTQSSPTAHRSQLWRLRLMRMGRSFYAQSR